MLMRRAAMRTVLLSLAAGAKGANAHDFWLVPDAFQVAAGASVRVRGQGSWTLDEHGLVAALPQSPVRCDERTRPDARRVVPTRWMNRVPDKT